MSSHLRRLSSQYPGRVRLQPRRRRKTNSPAFHPLRQRLPRRRRQRPPHRQVRPSSGRLLTSTLLLHITPPRDTISERIRDWPSSTLRCMLEGTKTFATTRQDNNHLGCIDVTWLTWCVSACSGAITTSAPPAMYNAAPKTAPAATSAGPGGNLVSGKASLVEKCCPFLYLLLPKKFT